MTTTKRNKIKLREVNWHLVCRLCSGYYVDATTLTECLHSFCRSCIIKYLGKNSFCPICEVQIHKTKPYLNLRFDKALQDLVYKLVPGLYHNEMARRRKFYEDKPEMVPQTTPEQRGVEERLIFSPEDSISLSLEFVESPDPEPDTLSETGEDFPLQLGLMKVRRGDSSARKESTDSNEPGIYPKRFLLCPAVVSIRLLKKFLTQKFELSSNMEIELLYKRIPLPEHYTLMDVAYIFTWKRMAPMRLFYQINEIPSRIVSKVKPEVVIKPTPPIPIPISKTEPEPKKPELKPSPITNPIKKPEINKKEIIKKPEMVKNEPEKPVQKSKIETEKTEKNKTPSTEKAAKFKPMPEKPKVVIQKLKPVIPEKPKLLKPAVKIVPEKPKSVEASPKPEKVKQVQVSPKPEKPKQVQVSPKPEMVKNNVDVVRKVPEVKQQEKMLLNPKSGKMEVEKSEMKSCVQQLKTFRKEKPAKSATALTITTMPTVEKPASKEEANVSIEIKTDGKSEYDFESSSPPNRIMSLHEYTQSELYKTKYSKMNGSMNLQDFRKQVLNGKAETNEEPKKDKHKEVPLLYRIQDKKVKTKDDATRVINIKTPEPKLVSPPIVKDPVKREADKQADTELLRMLLKRRDNAQKSSPKRAKTVSPKPKPIDLSKECVKVDDPKKNHEMLEMLISIAQKQSIDPILKVPQFPQSSNTVTENNINKALHFFKNLSSEMTSMQAKAKIELPAPTTMTLQEYYKRQVELIRMLKRQQAMANEVTAKLPNHSPKKDENAMKSVEMTLSKIREQAEIQKRIVAGQNCKNVTSLLHYLNSALFRDQAKLPMNGQKALSAEEQQLLVSQHPMFSASLTSDMSFHQMFQQYLSQQVKMNQRKPIKRSGSQSPQLGSPPEKKENREAVSPTAAVSPKPVTSPLPPSTTPIPTPAPSLPSPSPPSAPVVMASTSPPPAATTAKPVSPQSVPTPPAAST